jgi:hypothetical protein
MARPLTRLFQK